MRTFIIRVHKYSARNQRISWKGRTAMLVFGDVDWAQ